MGVALHLGAGLLWGYRILALSFALDHETDSKQLVQALMVNGRQRACYRRTQDQCVDVVYIHVQLGPSPTDW